MNLKQEVEKLWKSELIPVDLPTYEEATIEQRRLATVFFAAGWYAAGGKAQVTPQAVS